MKYDCLDCIFAIWDYCWFTCPISKKTYEDGDKNIPKECPYKRMTFKEVLKEVREAK